MKVLNIDVILGNLLHRSHNLYVTLLTSAHSLNTRNAERCQTQTGKPQCAPRSAGSVTGDEVSQDIYAIVALFEWCSLFPEQVFLTSQSLRAGPRSLFLIMINDTGLDTNVSELLPLLLLSSNHSAFPALRLESKSLVISATMFAVGVLGNLIAIIVLCVSKKEQKETTFYTLVCGMAITDLLGTCFTSPVVIATYVANRWPGGTLLCHFFSFSMLFFGSAGMSILCAMAVERYLAINHAYFYSRYIDRTMARFALLVAYLASIVLCIMPSFGFGRHVRHFPGTWCFLDWRAMDPLGACYSFLYGGVMLVLIAVTVLCNLAVCRSLVGMKQKTGIVRTELCELGGSRRRFPRLQSVTSAAEIQMFWLLIFMTIVFLVCSIPLVVRTNVYLPCIVFALAVCQVQFVTAITIMLILTFVSHRCASL